MAYICYKNIQSSHGLNIKQLRVEFYTAQNWLDFYYPVEETCIRETDYINNYGKTRSAITALDISWQKLTGELVLVDWVNLREINLEDNQIIALKIINCPQLTKIHANYNHLNKMENLPVSLTDLDLTNNQLCGDSNIFSHLINLETLKIGNDNEELINQGIYNKFTGSLAPLQNLTKLYSLDISNTDINEGVEYLSYYNLFSFNDSHLEKFDFKVKEIRKSLEEYLLEDEVYNEHILRFCLIRKLDKEFEYLVTNNSLAMQPADDSTSKVINWTSWWDKSWEFRVFSEKLTLQWIQAGFTKEQAREWLKEKESRYYYWSDNRSKSACSIACCINFLQNSRKLTANQYRALDKDLQDTLLEEQPKWMRPFFICDHCQKLVLKSSIYSNEKSKYLGFCSSSCQSDWNIYGQEWLERWYPQNGTCVRENEKIDDYEKIQLNNFGKYSQQITELDLWNQGLSGSLDLGNFTNLKALNCNYNQLTILDLIGCSELESLNCSDNHLTSLNLSNCRKLEDLLCKNNYLIELNLPNSSLLRTIYIKNNYLNTFDYQVLNPDTLIDLNLLNNNLETTDLNVFNRLMNLKGLYIGNRVEWEDKEKIKERINQGIYNRFVGSFQSLKNLTKLERLNIENTDINAGVEYLPISIQDLEYYIYHRPNCQLKEIEVELEQFDKNRRAYLKSKFKQSKQSKEDKIEEILKPYQEELKPLREKENFLACQVDLYERNFVPHLQNLLGQGGFAKVYKANWKGNPVAVKKSLYDLTDQKEIDAIKKEIELLKQLHNKYIIQYYDFYQAGNEFMIIIELAEQGTLTNYIEKHFDKEYDWNLNYNFIKHMTLGLTYLHESNIIHRDLKSYNVLICEGNIAKLADFGLSKVINNLTITKTRSKNNLGEPSGSIRWMDPYLFINRTPRYANDIYSLGMVIWEIVAKKIPYQDLEEPFVIAQLLAKNKEDFPENTPLVLQEIIAGCWDENIYRRITLEQILIQMRKELELKDNSQSIQTQIEIPPK